MTADLQASRVLS